MSKTTESENSLSDVVVGQCDSALQAVHTVLRCADGTWQLAEVFMPFSPRMSLSNTSYLVRYTLTMQVGVWALAAAADSAVASLTEPLEDLILAFCLCIDFVT